jgi:hypothetical protein
MDGREFYMKKEKKLGELLGRKCPIQEKISFEKKEAAQLLGMNFHNVVPNPERDNYARGCPDVQTLRKEIMEERKPYRRGE